MDLLSSFLGIFAKRTSSSTSTSTVLDKKESFNINTIIETPISNAPYDLIIELSEDTEFELSDDDRNSIHTAIPCSNAVAGEDLNGFELLEDIHLSIHADSSSSGSTALNPENESNMLIDIIFNNEEQHSIHTAIPCAEPYHKNNKDAFVDLSSIYSNDDSSPFTIGASCEIDESTLSDLSDDFFEDASAFTLNTKFQQTSNEDILNTGMILSDDSHLYILETIIVPTMDIAILDERNFDEDEQSCALFRQIKTAEEYLSDKKSNRYPRHFSPIQTINSCCYDSSPGHDVSSLGPSSLLSNGNYGRSFSPISYTGSSNVGALNNKSNLKFKK